MSALTQWLGRANRCTLNDDQKSDVINHIGYLCEMAKSVNDVLGECVVNDGDAVKLAHTASLLVELSGELNGLLQTPPSYKT